ncbi:MAG: hypothetical protein LVS60_03510 [Nodosilinea sp. LVE1205-7]|jgi:hypothetical protein
MTITDPERETIRAVLGYPLESVYTKKIDDSCNRITQHFPQAEATLRSALLEIARIQQQIKNVRPFAAETFSSSGAGTRQYNQPERLGSLYQEGRRWVQEVAALMRMPPYRPIFPSSSGTAGRINRSGG